jgi:hypothetical protein
MASVRGGALGFKSCRFAAVATPQPAETTNLIACGMGLSCLSQQKSARTSEVQAVMSEPNRIIRLRTVLARTGLSRSTIYRKIGEGTFPA